LDNHAAPVPGRASENGKRKVDRPFKVFVVTPLGARGRGGIDRLMDELRADFAARGAGDVHAVFSVTRGPGSLVFAPFYLASSICALVVRKIFRRIDLVHINLSQDGSAYRKIIVAWSCRLLHVPYVLHLHGSHFHHFWDNASPWFDQILTRLFSGAARIVVLGISWADYVAAKAPAAASRIVILPNASRAVVGRTDRTADDKLRLLFLGALGQRKGVPQLITALARVRDCPGWHAVLAGNGDVDGTRQHVERVHLAKRVTVPGWVDDQGVQELLRSADILILPSFDENLPMSVVEGFAHGLAVIATPVGATADIVHDEKTGLLVQPGDVDELTAAIRRLLGDADLRRSLGSSAKAFHADKLEIARYTEKLIATWKAAASDAR